MGSEIAFTILVLAVAAQRLWELRKSARHEAAILAAGGREHARAQMPVMRAVHSLWLIGMLLEAWLLEAWLGGVALPPWVLALASIAFVIGQSLRLLAMRTLGERWTVKVMTLPGKRAVSSGIFRWVRHPNYLGVILEIAALPLLGGAVVTSIAASIANAMLLRARITAEERALREESGYDEAMGGTPRFVPRARQA
jgi:methyltransferase